jgi:hypothetical protein
MQDKWLKDIRSYVDAIPYGQVQVEVERVDRRTVQVITVGFETLRYTDNAECLKDLLAFITSLMDDEHTGDVQFGLDMKQGNITLLTIKNTRRTNYQK